MPAWSAHRRIAGAVIAGLALTLAPAIASSASAAPDAPAPPTALRIDRSVAAAPGSINVTWNASPTTDISEYQIVWAAEGELEQLRYQGTGDRTFTVPDVEPGQSVEIEVRSLRSEVLSSPATLNATGLDDRAPIYAFTDTPGNTFAYEIAWLSSSAITTGYVNSNGSRFFAPAAPVLREQMAAFLYRFAEPYQQQSFDPPAVSPFADVSTTHRFYREITWLYSYGVTEGYVSSNGTRTFAPSAPVLREQFAAFLYRFDFAEFTTNAQTFTDVPRTATFHDQIEWMAAQGISTGYTEAGGTRTFRGSQPVLREQTAAFLYRYRSGTFVNPNTIK